MTSRLLGLALALGAVLAPLRAQPPRNLAPQIVRYSEDLSALERRYPVPLSPRRHQRLKLFHQEAMKRLLAMDYGTLGIDAQVDWQLLRNRIGQDLERLEDGERRDEDSRRLIPIWETIVSLEEARREMEPVEPRAAAERLHAALQVLKAFNEKLRTKDRPEAALSVALRAARRSRELARSLKEWFRFSDGYDPSFSWWVRAPYKSLAQALDRHAQLLGSELGKSDDASLVGDPIGEEALLHELKRELIPYSPKELVSIAEREFRWCDERMEAAAEKLGFKDWRKAQDQVKSHHLSPGEQPQLIASLAREAIAFLAARDLVTIPPLCAESWRMTMMSPARQRVSPYFLGGEQIMVSYPTEEMEHDEKLMSMKGNNRHFARATVFHELIPGHHLQQFMTRRHRPERRLFRTPFWIEGWALYWEMRLWDLGFAQGPEDEIGMLFWRKHRCARIIFSLSFHLGTMSPQECIDFLVERVGHEPANAEAEVRRSIGGDYGPLYQAAYMVGGLQIRALHRELVGGGKMSERHFHDAILKNGSIPIELLRASLRRTPIPRDFQAGWRFYPLGADKHK